MAFEGLIHYYYGNGSGKTSIALGHIIRALGHDFRPIMIQFLKKHDPDNAGGFYYGEYITLTQRLQIPVFQYGTIHFLMNEKKIDEEYQTLINEGMEKASEALTSGEFDLVILDEIITAIALQFIDLQETIKMLLHKRNDIEVILTGREDIPEIKEIADYVICLEEEKHPFQKGIIAREGIEF